MVSKVLACPYCNSTVTLLTAPRTGQRLRCPRCDEIIPYQPDGTESDEDARLESVIGSELHPSTGAPEKPTAPPPRWSNPFLAGLILLFMGAMATTALWFAWYTMEWRRSRDRLNNVAVPQAERIVATAPANLAALGYLPADTNVIAGIHVAELLENDATRVLLVNSGAPNWDMGQIERWTGIKMEDIDHAVLGLKLTNDRLLPRGTLVIETRRPYDTALLLKAMKAARKPKRHNRTLYRFTLDQPSISGVLWLPSDRALVMSMLDEDFDPVPATPTPGVQRFSPSLVRLFDKELSAGTQAWLIGDVAEWDTTLSLLSVLGLKKEESAILAKVRTFGTWLRLHDEVDWKSMIACADSVAASELDAYLADKNRQAGSLLKLLAAWPELQALIRDMSGTLTRERDGNWLVMQAHRRSESAAQTGSDEKARKAH
jgi:hypothetical protein